MEICDPQRLVRPQVSTITKLLISLRLTSPLKVPGKISSLPQLASRFLTEPGCLLELETPSRSPESSPPRVGDRSARTESRVHDTIPENEEDMVDPKVTPYSSFSHFAANYTYIN